MQSVQNNACQCRAYYFRTDCIEIFQVYFYDAKKNKARSKTSTAMYFALFFLLVFGLLGGIFTFLAAKLCMPLIHAGMDWMYFALMGLIAVLLGAFGSVFNTYAGLYLPKGNELLLSMPIPVAVLVSCCRTVWPDVVIAFPQLSADCNIYGKSTPQRVSGKANQEARH